jgi:hypothetical protein
MRILWDEVILKACRQIRLKKEAKRSDVDCGESERPNRTGKLTFKRTRKFAPHPTHHRCRFLLVPRVVSFNVPAVVVENSSCLTESEYSQSLVS